ncbi:type IV pilin protein [Synechococcus sp. UW179A]|uniref:type IV pilin protein n=1 Tax=Synechococcus sp. UW179A TaxID=2575510 RepID=UPI000E0FE975|nr:prepilin-type N-terminal cleavage/methylation domain-containing protein [Synechococcus sp. UW179A]
MSLKNKNLNGFSMVELLATVSIIGILGAVALPQYFSQVQKTRQNETAASLSQLQVTIAAFVDEMGLLPESWADLNKITPLMTPSGPASQEDFEWITLASASCGKKAKSESNDETNCYEANIKENDQLYTLEARSKNPDAGTYNVVACLDLRNGSSDLRKGTHNAVASIDNLRCMRNDQ